MVDIRLAAISNSLAATYERLPITKFESKSGGNILCSQCNHVIGTGISQVPVVTCATIRCPQCGVNLHLGKESPYKQPINMSHEVPAFSVPPHRSPDNAVWASSPRLRSVLNPISEAFHVSWNELQSPVPGVLHHYTSGTGLQGILSSGKIWASDLAYLNDASELQYAHDLISKVIDDIKDKEISYLIRSILDYDFFSITPQNTEINAYATCFCVEGDLLSQWRAYSGGHNGYSIAFEAKKLVTPKHRLRKVIYDPEVQRKLIESVIYKSTRAFYDLLDGEDINANHKYGKRMAFSAFIQEHLRDFIYSFKHPSFYEEKEWRLVTPIARHQSLDAIKFRNGYSPIVPYTEIQVNSDILAGPALPILTIRCGPSSTPQLNKKSLHLLLEQTNNAHVEVLGSDAPLRP